MKHLADAGNIQTLLRGTKYCEDVFVSQKEDDIFTFSMNVIPLENENLRFIYITYLVNFAENTVKVDYCSHIYRSVEHRSKNLGTHNKGLIKINELYGIPFGIKTYTSILELVGMMRNYFLAVMQRVDDLTGGYPYQSITGDFEENLRTSYVIFQKDSKTLVSFRNGETVLYGSEESALKDCRGDNKDIVLEIKIKF
jgi:hypothetical protein